MKLYLSGPMNGLPEHNYPAFEAARQLLRDAGYEVVCPAELGRIDGWVWADYLRRDLLVLLECEGVATLPGVENSRGAQLEMHVARELGYPIETLETWLVEAVSYA